jgi:hypothetical protein
MKINLLRPSKLISFATISAIVLCSAAFPSISWSMGTPPFQQDVRSEWGSITQESLDTNGCISQLETIQASSRYRNLRSREPIPNKEILATLSFPGKDKKGGRVIPVYYRLNTDSNGQVDFSISISQALEQMEKVLREDRFFRGVKRTRGQVNLSFLAEDSIQKSTRYVPARGLNFRICKQTS